VARHFKAKGDRAYLKQTYVEAYLNYERAIAVFCYTSKPQTRAR
jgi:hypothetical protein